MACIMKSLVRIGTITALAGGAAVVIAGPQRVGALFNQAKQTVNNAIDCAIDDPVALRAQLRDLEAQYPRKIAEVRGDLAELQAQKSQLQRELAVSRRVVELADADLGVMKDMLARAEEARATAGAAVIKVRLGDQPVGLDEAYGKAARINDVRAAYAARAGDIERDLGYLDQQESRLSGLLAQLEAERAEFQTQLWQLDRQVDTIARNERLIEIMSKRQASIDEHSRYRVASLDQLTTRFADIRAKQESQLESLARQGEPLRYEERAKIQIDGEAAARDLYPGQVNSEFQGAVVEPNVVEITPDPTPPPSPRPVASRLD